MKIAEAWTRFSALLPPISTWESHLGTLKKFFFFRFWHLKIWKWLLMNRKLLKLLLRPIFLLRLFPHQILRLFGRCASFKTALISPFDILCLSNFAAKLASPRHCQFILWTMIVTIHLMNLNQMVYLVCRYFLCWYVCSTSTRRQQLQKHMFFRGARGS